MADFMIDDPHYQPGEGEVAFDYVKAGDFRVVRADGVIGGLTPTGDIHFALYSERPAIPRRLVFAVAADGELGEENVAKRYARKAIVRDLSCGVSISPETAVRLAQWLTAMVKEIERESDPS
jgi:hypothetical protein